MSSFYDCLTWSKKTWSWKMYRLIKPFTLNFTFVFIICIVFFYNKLKLHKVIIYRKRDMHKGSYIIPSHVFIFFIKLYLMYNYDKKKSFNPLWDSEALPKPNQGIFFLFPKEKLNGRCSPILDALIIQVALSSCHVLGASLFYDIWLDFVFN